MVKPPVKSIAISEFKATCLAVLEQVRISGTPIVVTRRGVPIAEVIPPTVATAGETWLGSMRDSATIAGDLVEPTGFDIAWDADRS